MFFDSHEEFAKCREFVFVVAIKLEVYITFAMSLVAQLLFTACAKSTIESGACGP